MENARSGVALWDYSLGCHKRWKSLSFCEIWSNSTPPLLLIPDFFAEGQNGLCPSVFTFKNAYYGKYFDVLGVLNNIIITNLSYSICPGKELEQTFGHKLAQYFDIW